jgi:hypothetical protein
MYKQITFDEALALCAIGVTVYRSYGSSNERLLTSRVLLAWIAEGSTSSICTWYVKDDSCDDEA